MTFEEDDIVHIKRSELERLKQRDRNYSDDLYCHMSTQPSVVVLRTEYERIVGKADKYDKLLNEHILNVRDFEDRINELQEKAKQWDQWVSQDYNYRKMKEKAELYDLGYANRGNTRITKEGVDKLIEKASKWDNIINHEPIDEWREKAEKWDSLWSGEKRVTQVYVNQGENDMLLELSPKTYAELKEKANKWDNIINHEPIDEWRDKAKKWDLCTNGSLVFDSKKLEEWKEKARKWDELVSVFNVVNTDLLKS